ncbi:MAG: energy transducer TonB [Hyphomicrobiales bacterium]|nr:energy transducer TonB [Hyphomicrobiales bacterium]
MNALALPPRETATQETARKPWRALGVALALHASLAAALFVRAHAPVADVDDGAPAIEIDMVIAAPEVEPSQAPVGEAADASSAAPDSAARAKDETAERAPVERLADAPDAAPATPEPKHAPDKPRAETAPPSIAAAASEAAAPATIEAAPAGPVAKAPAIGLAESEARVRVRWQRTLVAHLDRHKRYPPRAVRSNAEVDVRFTIDRAGRILSSTVARSSGSAAFDEAALDMMRRSDLVPAPPPRVADEGLTFTVPVVFRTVRR